MTTGLLTLRKLQLKALRGLSRRELEHRIVRLSESLYRAEQFDEAIRLNDVPVLDEVPDMRCARCGAQPSGFRDKRGAAVWQLLELCQACQDAGPSTQESHVSS